MVGEHIGGAKRGGSRAIMTDSNLLFINHCIGHVTYFKEQDENLTLIKIKYYRYD